MIYVAWSVLYEGESDRRYFDVLIPRIIESILLERGRTSFAVPDAPAMSFKRGSNELIAQQICDSSDAFYLVFVHSDTGGRAQEAGIQDRGGDVGRLAFELCGFEQERVVLVAPRHEMESWALADPHAVCSTLGYRGDFRDLALPSNAQAAEALGDPKAVLESAMRLTRGRRRPISADRLLPVIAQEQDLRVLQGSQSFRNFYEAVYAALKSLGSVD